jgi:hypothetical protein
MQVRNDENNDKYRVHSDYIKCPGCGKETGLPKSGLLMVIPNGGLKCDCGATIIRKAVEVTKRCWFY